VSADDRTELSADRRAKVADAAAAALAAPLQDRDAVVRDRCAGDPRVEAEVLSLLRHVPLAEQAPFLHTAVPLGFAPGEDGTGVDGTGDGPQLPLSCHLKPGDLLGQYELVRIIGEGTYGLVFLARHRPISRHVAIKVLRTCLDSAAILARFSAERETLARMDHPNVARIYDAGATADGLPYFVMEHVDGGPITSACDQRRLGLRDRLELLVQACDGVQHAHQRGIIHRDLKPGNILVRWDGDRPVVKVIDFGVAKALHGAPADDVVRTQQGELVGTLRYMSPEQCAGDPGAVDVRSDVYGLGAVLYELLCGRPPHDLAGLPPLEAARRIVQLDPPAPRSIVPGISRPVETIILKALARDPERRFQSAADLAADLRRFLGGEPISALPPSWLSRLARLARRHKLAAAVIAALLVSLLILLSTTAGIAWLALRPDHIVIAKGQRFVELRSRAGHRLHLWDSGVDHGIWFAQMLERNPAIGRGNIVVVAYSRATVDPSVAGHVVAYRADRPQVALWSSADTVLAMPPGYVDRRTAHLDVSLVRVADVLPSAPGMEVVVVQELWPFSPNVVRVFDLAGRLRYQVWHEGGILDLAWLPGAGRLVLCGVNGEHRWDERGVSAPSLNYPMVVMAVEPRDGHTSDSWIVLNGRRMDETLRWYRWIGPANDNLARLAPIGVRFSRPGDGFDRTRSVELTVLGRSMGTNVEAGFTLVLDVDGSERHRWTGDGYKMGQSTGALPSVEVYRLLEYEDLPPALGRP
jgi:hypothetical protein